MKPEMNVRHVTIRQEGALQGRRDPALVEKGGDSITSLLDSKFARSKHSPPGTSLQPTGLETTKASRIAHLSRVPSFAPLEVAWLLCVQYLPYRKDTSIALESVEYFEPNFQSQYFHKPKHAGLPLFTLSSRRCYCSGADNRLGCSGQGDRPQLGHAS